MSAFGTMAIIPGASIQSVIRPVARFDVPMKVNGSKCSPSIGHASPSLRPDRGRIGNNETTSPSAVGTAIRGGAWNAT